MTVKPYIADNGGSGSMWLLPAVIVSIGPAAFRDRRKMFDVAFHWITFGFGICIEWGRK
jgi:hypothetical protein